MNIFGYYSVFNLKVLRNYLVFTQLKSLYIGHKIFVIFNIMKVLTNNVMFKVIWKKGFLMPY